MLRRNAPTVKPDKVVRPSAHNLFGLCRRVVARGCAHNPCAQPTRTTILRWAHNGAQAQRTTPRTTSRTTSPAQPTGVMRTRDFFKIQYSTTRGRKQVRFFKIDFVPSGLIVLISQAQRCHHAFCLMCVDWLFIQWIVVTRMIELSLKTLDCY